MMKALSWAFNADGSTSGIRGGILELIRFT